MNELQVLNYEGNEVRTIQKGEETWWVLKDVCSVMGLSNPTIVAARLDADEVTKFDLGGLSGESNIVNESGLYNVILRSDKLEAKRFKRWVTHEVLPSIRKHGMYAIDEIIENPDLAIQALTALKEEREKRKALQTEVAQQKQMIAEFSPKASYYDVVLQTKDALSASQIAKDYGKSAKWLNRKLHEYGVQYKPLSCPHSTRGTSQ